MSRRARIKFTHDVLVERLGLPADTIIVAVTTSTVDDSFVLDVKGTACPDVAEGSHAMVLMPDDLTSPK